MSSTDRYAQVILPLAVEGTFTYRVPDSLVRSIEVGSRVLVSFGKKRMYTAIVEALSSSPPEGITPKAVSGLLDDEPMVNQHQLQFWDWMASYYMCSKGEVMRAAMPRTIQNA